MGGASGGVVSGGIAQMFFGYDTRVLPLWVAAFLGAIVAGALSALATRSSLCKPTTIDANAAKFVIIRAPLDLIIIREAK